MTTTAPDMINRPPHYIAPSGLECLEVIRRYSLDFWLGNALKYLVRAGKKGDATSDLKKARFYLDDWRNLYLSEDIEEPVACETAIEWKLPDQIADEFLLTAHVRKAVVALLEISTFAYPGVSCADLARRASDHVTAEIDDIEINPFVSAYRPDGR